MTQPRPDWEVVEEMIERRLDDCVGCGSPDHFHLKTCREYKRVTALLRAKTQQAPCPLCHKPGRHDECDIQIGDVVELLDRHQMILERLRKMFGVKTWREGVERAVALKNAYQQPVTGARHKVESG